MPITLTVDHALRRVTAQAHGPVTVHDIRAHLEDETRSEGLPYGEVIDVRGHTPRLSASDVRAVVELLRDLGKNNRLGPTAVVVDTDVGYGMLRMIGFLTEDVCAVRPFRTMQEANAWLSGLREKPPGGGQ